MKHVILAFLAVAAFACGGKNGGGDDGGGDGGTGDGNTGDGGPGLDAGGGACTAGNAQCNNCIDDDSDTAIDGFDPECSGPIDNDESSFATGIPGDNMDAINQDCFFDGNSGAGNDGCNQHVCCLLKATNTQECTTALQGLVNNPAQEGQKYKVEECFAPLGSAVVPQQCKDVCGPLAPPGCDCFGCCTECDAQGCVDIAINPTTSPDCDATTIHDPTKCKPCQKVADCGADCGGCVLCPGQTMLPPECTDNTCPTGTMPCDANGQCPSTDLYCSNGCCIGVIGKVDTPAPSYEVPGTLAH
jgi:hypothetical protein